MGTFFLTKGKITNQPLYVLVYVYFIIIIQPESLCFQIHYECIVTEGHVSGI